MNTRWAWAITVLTLMAGSQAWSQQAPKPMIAWFGGYELLTFNDEVVWPLDLYADTYYSGSLYYQNKPDLFDMYSCILVGPGGSSALTVKEIAELEAWVFRGGVLFLTGTEGQKLLGDQVPSWVGARSWWNGEIKAGTAQVQRATHPLAKGLKPDMVAKLTGTGGLEQPTKGVSVIGNGSVSFLLVNKHGRGHVIYLGGKLSPQGRPKWAQRQIVQDMPAVAVQVWKNLMATYALATRSQAIAHWATQAQQQFATWWRYEPEKPLGGALYYQPYPRPGSDDELQALTFDVGMGERSWKRIFCTNARKARTLTVTPTDMVGTDGSTLPSSLLNVYVQEKPYTTYPKAPYWLVEPEYVEPIGNPAVTVSANRTTSWWVKLRCEGASPGEYAGALEFKDGQKLLQRLPITVKVWPVHQPGPDVLHYELEHMWFGNPGGYWISSDPDRIEKENNPALLANYMKHLGEMGVDFGQTWGDVAKGYCFKIARLKEDGRPWPEAQANDPAIKSGERLPHIDFSAYDSMYFDNAIKSGLTNFAMNYSRPGDLSPAQARREHWLMSQYATYLKERGYPWVYTKIMDEFGPDQVDMFIEQAKVIRSAGFKTYTTTPNFRHDRSSVIKIAPWLDMWQGFSLSKPWSEIARERNIPWDPRNELWAYTASSFWGNYIDYAQGAGWAMAWQRFEGLHTHGYMRWYWNDHEGALPGPDGPFDSVTVITNGRSVYQARYLASLYRMIEYAKKMGKINHVVAEVEKQIPTIIGFDGDALIPISRQNMSGSAVAARYGQGVTEAFPKPTISPTRHEAAKVRIIRLILRLKEALGPVRPTVKYGKTVLISDGKPVYRIVSPGAEDQARTLVRDLARLSETDPPVSGVVPKTGARTTIVLGVFADSEPIQKLVAQEVPGEITAFYPGPGRYAIKYLPDRAAGPLILITGGDKDGLEKGLAYFRRFWVIVNRW